MPTPAIVKVWVVVACMSGVVDAAKVFKDEQTARDQWVEWILEYRDGILPPIPEHDNDVYLFEEIVQ